MTKITRLLLCFGILCICCWAQSVTGPQKLAKRAEPQRGKEADERTRLQLTAVDTIIAPSEVATGFSDLVCDGDGNLYLGSDSPSVPGIRKLNSKGELLGVFQPTNPDVPVWGTGTFTVTDDGEVYWWVGSKKEVTRFVLVFKSDGSYKTNIKLQPGFGWMPASIAVFSNGSLLMTGQRFNRDEPMLPFTGIFSADGTLLKEVTLEADKKVHEMSVVHDARVTSSINPSNNQAISWGRMEAATDGNVYVMRWLSPAVVYAVSPGGAVVRRFSVDPGSPDFMPIQMHITGNRIAVLFEQRQTKEKIMKLVDLEGQEVAAYDIKPRTLGGAFACFTLRPQRFMFLSFKEDDHRIEFLSSEAR